MLLNTFSESINWAENHEESLAVVSSASAKTNILITHIIVELMIHSARFSQIATNKN